MNYREELYCKLDMIKQAVIDLDEYVDIIDEVMFYLDGLSNEN